MLLLQFIKNKNKNLVTDEKFTYFIQKIYPIGVHITIRISNRNIIYIITFYYHLLYLQ